MFSKELVVRPRVWTCRNGGRDEDQQLACLFPCLEWHVGSHGVPVRVRELNKAPSRRRDVRT